ncbi:MAG: cytochrome c biogenesis protein ResB [Clostridia bacterium]|nr:cytochrome c biogenesis protein ResB [Clostridia bacterium]
MLKKIWKFISSMRFAIALLLILALACAASSLITQNQTYAWYSQRYSERTAGLIMALHLDDAFHSPWFIAITAFLCLNLLLCNLVRLPQLIRRTKAETRPEAALNLPGDVSAPDIRDAEAVFKQLRMPGPTPCKSEDGRDALFAARNAIGLWGAWVCHLGILLLILGFGLGQMTQRQYAVYGVPGQIRRIGDTECFLTIDDFRVDKRADGSVAQYTTDITVEDAASAGRKGGSASISVNHPANLCGMKFYQNSTGWAAQVDVYKDGAPIQQEVVCAGDYMNVTDKEGLVVMLNAFYPDYVMTPGVGPSTASDQLNNPAYLYSVYYQGQVVGMNALMDGEEITIDAYTVTFSNPQSYTLIQVKVDRFTPLALVGGLVTMLGLLLALYVQPSRVWAIRQADGLWAVYGQSRKGGALFREQFEKAIDQRSASHASD